MKNLILILILLPLGLAAQTETATSETKPPPDVSYFSGQFMVSSDFSSVYFNMVGAGVRYNTGKLSIGWSVFPTLRFHQDTAIEEKRPFVTAGFATGPIFQYKHVIIGFPAFYDSHDLRWRYTVGFGFKIGR